MYIVSSYYCFIVTMPFRRKNHITLFTVIETPACRFTVHAPPLSDPRPAQQAHTSAPEYGLR